MYLGFLFICLFVSAKCTDDEFVAKDGRFKSKRQTQRRLNTAMTNSRTQRTGLFDAGEFICYPKSREQSNVPNEIPTSDDKIQEDRRDTEDFYDSIASLASPDRSREFTMDNVGKADKYTKNREGKGSRHRRRRPLKPKGLGVSSGGSISSDFSGSDTDDGDEQLELERCSVDHEVYRLGVTDSSPAYTMKIYASNNHSDLLLKGLHDRFLDRQQPEFGKAHSICDRHFVLGKGWDTSARALCPFRWVMDEPNPARFPERLMTARCSCQLSKPIFGLRAKCVEVRENIPVLWRIGCNGDNHVYRQGYDQISVACAPVGFIIENEILAESVEGSDLLRPSF